jgi:tetratricopeptide (TPR) repeat protein
VAGRAHVWRPELEKGIALLRQGELPAAYAAFHRAHLLDQSAAEPAFALGRAEWARGNMERAESLLRVALKDRPRWALAAAVLARILIGCGRYDRARKTLARSLQANPHHPALWAVSGELSLEEGAFDDAAQQFRTALSAGASQAMVSTALAHVENRRGLHLVQQGQLSEAAFAFRRASHLQPAWSRPLAHLGALFLRLKRPDRAQQFLQRALGIDGEDATALFHLSLLRRTQSREKSALEALQAAARATSPHPRALVEWALCLEAEGQHEEALDWLTRSLEHQLVWADYFPVEEATQINWDELKRAARSDRSQRVRLVAFLTMAGRRREASRMLGRLRQKSGA